MKLRIRWARSIFAAAVAVLAPACGSEGGAAGTGTQATGSQGGSAGDDATSTSSGSGGSGGKGGAAQGGGGSGGAPVGGGDTGGAAGAAGGGTGGAAGSAGAGGIGPGGAGGSAGGGASGGAGGAGAAGGAGGAGGGGGAGGSGGAPGCIADAQCDDGVFCNGEEQCVLGVCEPDAAPSCDDGVACTDDFCDQGADQCAHGKNDGKCNDDSFCNGKEVCDPSNGDPKTGCAKGKPVDCDDGVPCTTDACDDATGECKQVPDDAACSNGKYCDGVEMCLVGVGCAPGVAIVCDDGLACTADACDDAAGKCVHAPNDGVCSDGLDCNGQETCDPAGPGPTGCKGGQPIPCASDGVDCTVDACDEATNQCDHAADNGLCPPGKFCVPQLGGCMPAKPCSKDADCDDNDACNGTETCNVTCKPGAPIDCDDGVACTVDSCNSVTGKCTHATSDAICDDSFACNGKETCDGALGCVKSAPPACDDGLACTFDECLEPSGTCAHYAQDFLCDDSNLCNGTEKCGAKGCEPGAPYVCPEDGVACTKEVCDPALGACKPVPDDSLCPCGQTCDAAQGGCGKFCKVQTCGGKVYQCGDCVDNDADCKLDGKDTQCLGPCDNTENFGPIQGSGCYYAPPPGQFSPKLDCAWNGPPANGKYPTSSSVVATPAVMNMTDDNGDGKVDTNDVPDIAIVSYPYGSSGTNVVLRLLSGACKPDGTMQEHWTLGLNEIKAQLGAGFELDFSAAPAVGDIDGDGLPDIVVVRKSGGTLAVTNTGKVKWYQASYPTGTDYNAGITPALADLDANGKAEVVLGRVVLNGKDGTLKWKGSASLGINGFLGPVATVADPDLDGKLNVLAGNTMYTDTGQVKWTYAYPVASNASNCGSGTQCDGFTAVGNFDGDDFGEIAIVRAGVLYILNHDGKPLVVNGANVAINIPKGACGLNEGGPPTIADFDGDGKPEVGVAGSDYYIVADLECLATPKPAQCSDKGIRWKVTNDDCSSRVTGSSVFDFDGDGQAEVIYNDETYFRVFRGADGLLLIQVPNKSQTRLEMPVVADVDNDGNAEIVFIENNTSKHGIRIYDDANDSWVATRRVWNQHSYHVTNVSEAGVIPKVEPPNWLEPSPSTISGKMNNFRQNLPEYDVLSAPDLTVSMKLDPSTCPSALTVEAKVCNEGLLQVGPGVSVTFYDDSTQKELVCKDGPAATTGNLAPKQCETVVCKLSFPGTITLKACVDNGSFTCTSGGNNECKEDNNTTASAAQCPG